MLSVTALEPFPGQADPSGELYDPDGPGDAGPCPWQEAGLEQEGQGSAPARFWAALPASLRARRLDAQGVSFLALWLEAGVEEVIDEQWRLCPSRGFACDALAGILCRRAALSLLPGAAQAPCLPFPVVGPALRRALEQEGLPLFPAGAEGFVLGRRYALLTYYPFNSACVMCSLREWCPNAVTASDNKELDMTMGVNIRSGDC